MRFDRSRRNLLPLTAALMILGPGAQADSGRLLPRDMPPAYRQECASCHTAYPPGMLPAASWQRIMTGLDKHYGTDAALDAARATDARRAAGPHQLKTGVGQHGHTRVGHERHLLPLAQGGEHLRQAFAFVVVMKA